MSGGSVMAALGVSWREESVRAPSANGFQTEPYERYLSVNTVAATGAVTVPVSTSRGVVTN